jgi:hypothetical protein
MSINETYELTIGELDTVSGGSFFDFLTNIGTLVDIAQGMQKTIQAGAVAHATEVVNQVGNSIKNTPH